jgi:steroid 5-alpha reductase family enzyme
MIWGILSEVLFIQWAAVTFLFAVSIAIKRNDIADIAWGPGIALASWVSWWFAGQPTTMPVLLVLGAVSLWAIRIGWRIARKNLHKPEDPRYRRWRESWGVWFYPRSYLQVFLLQGALMIVMSLVVLATVLTPDTLFITPLLWLGGIVWVLAFITESVADHQLDRFISNPANKGKLMRHGLWRYSRHPNYFGEITMWWGLFLMTLGTPFWYIALIPALTITGLILFVSGIPLLEEQMAKYDEWEEYKKQTSPLIPLPPKHH